MNRRCDTCSFSHEQPDSPLLQCRRRPPVVVPAPRQVSSGPPVEQGWPLVSGEDWCGDYQGRVAPVARIETRKARP